ncbi:MAG TPA: TolC family protein [Burkholderiales bacterium]
MRYVVCAVVLFAVPAGPVRAESLTFRQVLQRAVTYDASLQIARLELERARLETTRVESQLDWNASGQAGVARDISFFGVPVDRADARAGLDRRLESGSSVGVGVGVVREDANSTPFPFLPNPSRTVSVDANYRLPLAQGSDNAGYRQGIVAAEAGIDVAQAQWGTARNQLALQVADAFHAAAFTYARLRSALDAIDRAERLKRFVLRNVQLGIAEDKDRLQAEAQLRARVAEQQALRAAWDNQRIVLNRLMERAPQSEWQPQVEPADAPGALDVAAIQAEAEAIDPDLQREAARVRIAESAIARRRDSGRDKFDLIFSIGNRQLSGDVAGVGNSNDEAVAGARLEFRAALDKRGADAELNQAFLERDIARRRFDTNLTNLRYNVARVGAEIDAIVLALGEAGARKDAERRKLDEATRRHRTGRATTAELIQFENDYEAAVLAVEQQAIELARRRTELERLRGAIWRDVDFAPRDAPEPRR